MKTERRVLVGCLVVAGLASSAPIVSASPTVIEDVRLEDLAITPALGRGYSIATNTYSSICLLSPDARGLERTTPSYNFDYSWDELEFTDTTNSKTSAKIELKFKKKLGFLGGVDLANMFKATIINNETYYSHNILVQIDVHSYYASVDESKAKLSVVAKRLLDGNDIVGFFDACGLYYVRSIGRRSTFNAIFTYRTKNTERDTTFENDLRAKISGFGAGGGVDADISKELRQEMTAKHLTIKTWGSGLGKENLNAQTGTFAKGQKNIIDTHGEVIILADKERTLTAYDIDSFRAAITTAFTSMQDTDVGIVRSIEVVPWVENLGFQDAVKLETGSVAVVDAQGSPVLDGDGNPTTKQVLLYEKKRTLMQNGEFLAEIDRAARGKVNSFYKAKLCRRVVRVDYKTENGEAFREEYQGAKARNNVTGDLIDLSALDAMLSEDRINELFASYNSFVNGEDGNGGAMLCVRDLMAKGIATTSYRTVPTCTKVVGEMLSEITTSQDRYCLPDIVLPAPAPAP